MFQSYTYKEKVKTSLNIFDRWTILDRFRLNYYYEFKLIQSHDPSKTRMNKLYKKLYKGVFVLKLDIKKIFSNWTKNYR